MNEIWKDVKGFEGLYQCSSEGRMKSLDRFDSRGRKIRGKILKPYCDKNGYFKINLYENSVVKRCWVHRLVTETFIPNPYNLPCVNHKDENPSNNCIENLEWCTYQYNINYGTARQRTKEKLNKPVVQYTLDGVFVAEYPSAKDVKRLYGYDNGHIGECCNGKRKTAYSYVWRYKK